MLRILLLISLIIPNLSVLTGAESLPQTILYQGRLKEAGLHVDGIRNFTVALHDAASGGSALWTEEHSGVPVLQGLFQLALGSTQAIPDSVLVREELWVAVSVGALELPRSRLHSTPHARIAGHALSAEVATTVLDGAITDAKLDAILRQRLVELEAEGRHGWVASRGRKAIGTSGSDIGMGIASDADGNIYITGYTTGALDGHTLAGERDIVLIKWNAAGVQQWSRQIGTSGRDEGLAVATDADGNVYVTGYTFGSLNDQPSAGALDIVLIKWNADGDMQWTRQIGTATDDIGLGVATDADGNVYVSGYTLGSFDGHVSAGDFDIVLIKWNADGVMQWTSQIGSPGWEFGQGVATDAAGNVYVTGYTNGALGDQSSAGGRDIFVIKWNTDGTVQWTRQIGNALDDQGFAVATDGDGNVYVSGFSMGALSGQTWAGSRDIVLIKWDTAGDLQWTRQVGTSSSEQGFGVATDTVGNIYVSGYSSGALGGQIAAGGQDVVLIKWNAAGVQQWTRQIGSSGNDIGRAVATDAAGNVYITGSSTGQFAPSPPAGLEDLILLKFYPNGDRP